MNNLTAIQVRQMVALGRDREAALKVILLRVLGALKTEGVHRCSGRIHGIVGWLEVSRHNFIIRLSHHESFWLSLHVYYRVSQESEDGKRVFSAQLYSDGRGYSFGGRLKVSRWIRNEEYRTWQAELFDTFSEDSNWLLDIEPKIVKPEIVTAFLSHVATVRILPL